MNLAIRLALFFMFAAVLFGSNVLFASDLQVMTWTVGGVKREALIFVPSKDSAQPNAAVAKAPVIFAFHWHGGTMEEAAKSMRFQNLWPEAIVVYMQGLATRIYVDPLGLDPGWQQEPGQFGDRDLHFFDAVLTTLRTKFPLDERRIYATGFSNGGIFTYLLWGSRANVFAAFAPVGAQLYPKVQLTEPRPLLHIAGESDDVVSFKQQLHSIEVARHLDGTAAAGMLCGQYCTRYAPRNGTGAPVVTYIHHGGHVLPSWAPAAIVKLFQSSSLPE